MDDEYRRRVEEEVAQWEKRTPSMLQRIGESLLGGVSRGLGRLIPNRFQELAAAGIETGLSGLTSTMPHSISIDGVKKHVASHVAESGDELHGADLCSRDYWTRGVAAAGVEGAITGVIGVPGIVVDIPALFGITVRTIQQMGLCYGFDPTSDKERAFVLHVLQCGTTEGIKERTELIAAAKEFEQAITATMIKNLAKRLGIQITRRRALQVVPLASAGIGLVFNSLFVNEIFEAAFMLYRKRYLQATTPKPIAMAAAK